jgi:tetratricopeptide (TPR) repeat protein
MASVDPYAPCPCGSGQKYKWCCHKVEAYAERSQRLYDGNQLGPALVALDEGLRKVPDSPLLLLRKAIIEIRGGKFQEGLPTLEHLLAKHPGHVGAHALFLRVLLETDGPVETAARLQTALSQIAVENRPGLARVIDMIAMVLADESHVCAAIEHYSLALELIEGDDSNIEAGLRRALGNPAVSPWLREIHELSPAPANLPPKLRERFDKAIGWANEGLWASAAAAFETLAADGVNVADRNQGLCRLWVADEGAAVPPLRRYIARLGETPEAVDLEALCQIVEPLSEDELVEHIQLTWPLRDRAAFLAVLSNEPTVDAEGESPSDEDDPDSPVVSVYSMLDRPKPKNGMPATVEELPRIVCRIHVGSTEAALDTYDDGRLDAQIARFVELAGTTIRPAHPKTKVLGKTPRLALILQSEWWLPAEFDPNVMLTFQHTERVRILHEVWPETPLPVLGGRSPRQAAKAGNATVPLRAAICQFELVQEVLGSPIDFTGLRKTLGISPEPEFDPETVEIAQVHVARLNRIPVDRLNDERLVSLYLRARDRGLPHVLETTAREITRRPHLLPSQDIDILKLYTDLANLAASRARTAEALHWLKQGQSADTARGERAARWDMAYIRLFAHSEPPEQWVPKLALVLDHYQNDQAASTWLLAALVEMRLIDVMPNPDDPQKAMFDTKRLNALMERYGPKITTGAGQLGISATKGRIWTPDAERPGAAGGIWTPGSAAPPAVDKPRLIVPGR